MADTEAPPAPQAPEAKTILYCPHCTFPPEYCSFSNSASKCKAWLIKEHPELAEQIYGSSSTDGAATAGDSTTEKASSGKKSKKAKGGDATAADEEDGETGLEGQLEEGLTLKQKQDEDKESAKKERREEKKKEKEEKERKSAKVVLTKHSRTKKKATTSISGLHFFSPPLPALKVLSKGLATKLATGCSVSKSPSNPNVDEIIVQGDVAEDVRDMILRRVKPFNDLKEGDIGEDQVKVEEEKKKAPPKEPEVAAQ